MSFALPTPKTVLTNLELIKKLRRPGKIRLPILTANDVLFVTVEKYDLIEILQDRDPNELAPWMISSHTSGIMTVLDVV